MLGHGYHSGTLIAIASEIHSSKTLGTYQVGSILAHLFDPCARVENIRRPLLLRAINMSAPKNIAYSGVDEVEIFKKKSPLKCLGKSYQLFIVVTILQ